MARAALDAVRHSTRTRQLQVDGSALGIVRTRPPHVDPVVERIEHPSPDVLEQFEEKPIGFVDEHQDVETVEHVRRGRTNGYVRVDPRHRPTRVIRGVQADIVAPTVQAICELHDVTDLIGGTEVGDHEADLHATNRTRAAPADASER